MKQHVANLTWGALDYVAYPAGMLLAAPLMLRHLGTAAYGLWAVAMAVVSTGAILASGFGDASLQIIAAARSEGHRERLIAAVRSSLTVHTTLGALLGTVCLAVAEPTAGKLAAGDVLLMHQAVIALRFAGLMVLVRAVEAVCIGTQRAFERYGRAVGVSLACRVLSLLVACVLVKSGRGVDWLLGSTLTLSSIGLVLQLRSLKKQTGAHSLIPSLQWSDIATLVEQGRYTWMVAAAGVVFSYTDRIVLGLVQGAAPVAWYALCVQIAQPVYGLAANALHFQFPHLARVRGLLSASEFRAQVRAAQRVNLLMVSAFAAGAYFLGELALHLIDRRISASSGRLLTIVVISYALLGASVTATYALFAIRRAAAVAWTMLFGAVLMMGSMLPLLGWWGAEGMAVARSLFGATCLLLYVPLWRALHSREGMRDPAAALPLRVPEGGAL